MRAHNTGAAFSFLAGAVGLAALVLHRHRRRPPRCSSSGCCASHAGQKLFSFALACILGGAIGNVVDRLLHGYVVDFLQFHWRGWYFPAFNVADSAITVGAVCLILDELLRVRAAK